MYKRQPYYYVVAASNAAGTSGNSSEASATPTGPTTNVSVTVDVLANRHTISPYIYGGAYPKDAATITNSGMTVVRWGGNATSRYNWKLQTSNSANDYYFSDYTYTEIGDSDSVKFVQDAKAAGGNPLMSMVMLDWVSKGDPANGTGNGQLYSFSVATYGSQCGHRPDNSDAGNGVKADCTTNVTNNNFNDAHVPLKDSPQAGDPAGTVYRNQWAAALATAFGSAPHFYDMDNEMDIWGGTHRDVHPDPSGFNELRDTYLRVARNLKTWDPAAIRLGPVACCWWYYWNGPDPNNDPNNDNKNTHGHIDHVPWWLNEVSWRDSIDGVRSLDVFDIHAYPEGPNGISSQSKAQKQAASIRVFRDWWDPTYTSENSEANQIYATSIQPNRTVTFRIPRMKALMNTIYPGTKFAITEWSTGFADNTNVNPPIFDFSTALSDAMGYGILGQQNAYLASRWTAPDPTAPAYQTLKLFRNYDGSHHTFGNLSVDATHNADASLFNTFAAVDTASGNLTILVVNGDPVNAAQVTFTLKNFASPSTFKSYALSQANPTSIVASGSQAWNATQTFPAYSATLLVVSGMPAAPASEWELNPTEIMAPAAGTAILSPRMLSGSGNVSLTSAALDTAGGGSISLTNPTITATTPGTLTINAGNTPGFYHFTVTGTDGTNVQKQGGWLVIGNPPATLTNGSPSSGTHGTPVTLKVTLNPGNSIGTPACGTPPCGPTFASGASVLFTVDAGTLSGGAYGNATHQIATVDSTGVASVTLTLPASGVVNVQAEGPFALGHPLSSFTVTAN